jgi:membrane associated rhomboid family serine protease
MQREHPHAGSGVLTWMLCTLLAGFVVQNVFGVWLRRDDFQDLLALSSPGIRSGFIWTLLTHALLHGGILPLLLNGLMLFFVGRELVPLLGERRFLAVTLAAVFVGGLVWLATHYVRGGSVLIGSSAGVIGLFILFACFFPYRQMTFLLFFVIPVTIRPIYAAWILVGLDTIGFLFSELPGAQFDTGVAHSAHLGGMLVGYLYFRFVHANNGWDRAATFQLPGWLSRTKPPAPTAGTYQVNVTPKTKDLKAEVDRVLDKINSQGFGALTPEEKRILDEAKDMLSRR